jgi:hypothetical protein
MCHCCAPFLLLHSLSVDTSLMLGSIGQDLSLLFEKIYICFQHKGTSVANLGYDMCLQDETLRNAVNAFKGRYWKKIGLHLALCSAFLTVHSVEEAIIIYFF